MLQYGTSLELSWQSTPQIVLHCDLCNVELNSLKERADHDMSDKHQENKKKLLEENEKSKASLTFDKPIFTEEFLKYNKGYDL